MSDQTLIPILLGVLAVLGTLGGALGSTILANRRAKELEEFRSAQEKLKRNTEIIEEAYSQLMLFSELSNQISSSVLFLDISESDFLEKSEEVYLKFNRLYVLISLYHRSLKQELGDLNNTFNAYWITVGHLYDAKKQQRQKANVIDGWVEKVNEERSKFNTAHQKFQKSLEALVH